MSKPRELKPKLIYGRDDGRGIGHHGQLKASARKRRNRALKLLGLQEEAVRRGITILQLQTEKNHEGFELLAKNILAREDAIKRAIEDDERWRRSFSRHY